MQVTIIPTLQQNTLLGVVLACGIFAKPPPQFFLGLLGRFLKKPLKILFLNTFGGDFLTPPPPPPQKV